MVFASSRAIAKDIVKIEEVAQAKREIILMKRIILSLALIFSACQAKINPPPPQTVELANQNSAVPASDFEISSRGIGKAKLGMTVGKLQEISDQDTVFEAIPSFMVDLDAIAVSQDGIVQYYILHPAGDNSQFQGNTINPNLVITALMTDNDNYQTKQGVKVGTPIEEAEEIYGDAILAYNIEGESREYITFGDRHPENIQFRASYFKLISNGLGFSGIYPEYPGVSYTTDKYRDDAAIAAIEVSCARDNCLN